MTTARLLLSLAIGGIIVVLVIEETMFWGPGRAKRQRLQQADHRQILADCRQLIADISTSNHPAIVAKPEEISPAIHEIRPSYVLVSTDHVLMCLSALPRIYVLAFATNAVQYGTTRLIDGLWYLSNPADDRKKAQQSHGADAASPRRSR